jgi:hypothetical protein
MKNKIFIGIAVGAFAIAMVFNISLAEQKKTNGISLENIVVMAQAQSEINHYHICYHTSKVRKGYTYYDCGSCSKVYDEKGKGDPSKCFY